jgi:hypothetical protein
MFKVHTLLCTANNVTPNNRFVIRDFRQVFTSLALCSTADKVRTPPARPPGYQSAARRSSNKLIKGNNKTGLTFLRPAQITQLHKAVILETLTVVQLLNRWNMRMEKT